MGAEGGVGRGGSRDAAVADREQIMGRNEMGNGESVTRDSRRLAERQVLLLGAPGGGGGGEGGLILSSSCCTQPDPDRCSSAV